VQEFFLFYFGIFLCFLVAIKIGVGKKIGLFFYVSLLQKGCEANEYFFGFFSYVFLLQKGCKVYECILVFLQQRNIKRKKNFGFWFFVTERFRGTKHFWVYFF
jgi:hypothetical protein